jgi:hypothetical protein
MILEQEFQNAGEVVVASEEAPQDSLKNCLAEIVARDVAEARARTEKETGPTGPLAEMEKAVRAKDWAVEGLRACRKSLDATVEALKEIAENEPQKLGEGFIEKIEAMVPWKAGRVDAAELETAIDLYDVIIKAAKHGSDVVPDSWTQSICDKATPAGGADWAEWKDGNSCLFYLDVLKRLARICPERIDENAYSSVSEIALLGSKQRDVLYVRPEELCSRAYTTLWEFVNSCGTERMPQACETRIRDDAEGRQRFFSSASSFCNRFCDKREEEAKARSVTRRVIKGLEKVLRP